MAADQGGREALNSAQKLDTFKLCEGKRENGNQNLADVMYGWFPKCIKIATERGRSAIADKKTYFKMAPASVAFTLMVVIMGAR